MHVLQSLGVDTIGAVAIGAVALPEKGWEEVARKMIDDRRSQLSAAFKRVKTERQEEALNAELKRMADLEAYVRACEFMKAED